LSCLRRLYPDFGIREVISTNNLSQLHIEPIDIMILFL
jgi:hypothetical protein